MLSRASALLLLAQQGMNSPNRGATVPSAPGNLAAGPNDRCELIPRALECGSSSMDSHATSELEQMVRAWGHAGMGINDPDDTSRQLRSVSSGSYQSYNIFEVHKHPRCVRFIVHETTVALGTQDHPLERRVLGGASFLAMIEGDELHVCEVVAALEANGTYIISCPRPRPGTCSNVTVTLNWELYDAFHNAALGGGKIKADSGGARRPQEQVLLHKEVCGPEEQEPLDSLRRAREGWVKTSATGLPGPWATWQDKWVWRDRCGRYQQMSGRRSSEYQACFKSKFVEFVGDSHLNYISFCLMDEVMHYTSMAKPARRVSRVHKERIDDTDRERIRQGKDMFFQGVYAQNKTLFEQVRQCGENHDCLGRGLDHLDPFYEDDPTDSSKVIMRACSYKVRVNSLREKRKKR